MNEIILELAALLLTAFCLIYSVTARKKLYFPMPKGLLAAMKSQHFSFLIMLLAVALSAASSVAGRVGEFYRADAGLLECLHTFYYVFHNMLSVCFALYILDMAGPVRDQGRKFFFFFCLPLVLGELLILSNPLTHLCFYVDEQMVYHRGSELWVLYAIGAVYTVTGYLYFFKFKGTQSRTDRVATLILITVAIVGVIVQAIWSLPVELFFEAIAFLGFMVLLERDPDRATDGPDKQFSGSLIIAVALTFLAVILMNVTMILNLNSAQSDKIGNVQLNVIRSDLENMISEAETNVLRVAIGAEQALNDGEDRTAVEAYFDAQRDAFAIDESVLCVYIGAEDWHYLPGFDAPADYRATERDWYRGAIARPGAVYITEPYTDANTGEKCFTVSAALSDGGTVVAMDLSFDQVQESIRAMENGEDQAAMIVTSGGLIAGYTDMALVGQRADEMLPEYAEVLRRVAASNEHGSFRVHIDGRPYTVFSAETGNGWYLILTVNTNKLYADSYRQMGMMAAVNLLMLVTVLVFYMVSTRSRLHATEVLEEKERFIAGLSGRFRDPLSQILRLSDWQLIEESDQPAELVRQIKESGLQLSEAVDDIRSYSGMLRKHQEHNRETAKKQVQATGALSRKLRNSVILTLLFALMIALFFSTRSTVKLGSSRINREADGYENMLNGWIGERQGVVKMMTGLLSTHPAMLEDADGIVWMLDGLAGRYPEIYACYLVDADAPQTLIVNSGRQSDENLRALARSKAEAAAHASEDIQISAPFVDGKTGERCISLTRAIFDETGAYIGMFGIDCTIEQLLRSLRERDAGIGYAFLIDADGDIINHPDPARQLSGEKRVSVEDTEYAEAYHSETVTLLRDFSGNLVSCLSRKTDVGFTVVIANRAWSIFGSMILLSLAALGLFVVCVLLIVALINRMIRWQEEINRQLVASADAAVNAGKAKSQFLAQMSHEIRTPINAVLGMNEMILDASSDPEIREYAANIQNAGQTLLSLINSILDFSKIEDGKMEILHVRYETQRLIDDLVNMISERAVKKGLELELDIDPTLPRALYGDDMRLRQIITNLLTNAVKYTPSGTITLRMQMIARTEERCELYVCVSDTGIGIRTEDLDKLFDSFRRLDQERNRSIEGTGLGIAIVQRLLEMMDSRLEVHSVYGEGSDFSFRISQQVVEWEPIGAYAAHRSALDAESARRETVWAPDADVLVVDDNDMNLKVAKGLLKRAGIVPDLAESGEQCLAMTQHKHYDIIFLDHMMPVMDGVETLHALTLRGDLPDDTAVIVLTANAVHGAREEYLKAGFRDYLSKPIETDALDQMLARYLPERKVHWRSAAERTAPAAQPQPGQMQTHDPLEALAAAGFQTEAGLRYVAGERRFYIELLRGFAAEQPEKARAIAEDCARGDLTDYRIRVHSLKGIARQIGADALSELALEQELAVKNGDAAAISAGCAPLLERYRAAAETVRNALDAEAPAAPATAQGEISPEELRDTLSEALSYLDNLETERAIALLDAQADRTFGGTSLRTLLFEAMRALDNYETKAATQALYALLSTL